MKDRETNEANSDLSADTQSFHPAGTGAGAAAGGIAGAAIGTAVGGPLGGVVGGAIGATGGGMAGKSLAEAVDAAAEEAYWRTEYPNWPYYDEAISYDAYSAAFRTGYTGYGVYAGQFFDEVEGKLEEDYQRNWGSSQLPWSKARRAARDAWERIRTRHSRE